MQHKKAFALLVTLAALGLAATQACPGDFSAPSPKLIVMHYNTVIIKDLLDNCYVKLLEVAYSKGNVTKTILATKPMVKTVKKVEVTIPVKPPYTLTILYADLNNNTGTLTWKIDAEPFTVHTLVKMVMRGASAIVQILGPPEKPLLPRLYADPGTQTTVINILSVIAFLIGLIKYMFFSRSA